MKDVVAVIMGGGQGTRLYPLTRDRAKPAVPVAGRARLIDIPMSNCLNSGITKLFVLTQFNSASLNRHIAQCYHFGALAANSGVQVLAAEQTMSNRDWFQGTADAVRRSLHHVIDGRTRRVLILAGDHLYRMNYQRFLERHDEANADITISVCPVAQDHASSFGLLHCDENGFVTRFAEKPTGDDLEAMRVDPAKSVAGGQAPGAPFLASMGIYVFTPHVLTELLEANPESHDFGKEIIPAALDRCRVAVHFFHGYWEDIGTISAFYRANIALTQDGQFSLYDPDFPLYTRPRYLSATRIEQCDVQSSLIAEGCVIGRSRIKDSVVGIRSRIGDQVEMEGALLMGNDLYETETERAAQRARNVPPLGVGDGTVIRRAILDKGARVGRDVALVNEKGVQEADGDCYFIREGLVIVPKNAIVPDGTVV